MMGFANADMKLSTVREIYQLVNYKCRTIRIIRLGFGLNFEKVRATVFKAIWRKVDRMKKGH